MIFVYQYLKTYFFFVQKSFLENNDQILQGALAESFYNFL